MPHSGCSWCCQRFAPAGSDRGGAWRWLRVYAVPGSSQGLSVGRDAHGQNRTGALDYKEWFVKGLTLVITRSASTVDPVSWVNRHRCITLCRPRRRSQQAPRRRLLDDAVSLCVSLPCTMNVAPDESRTWPFRLVSHPLFMVLSPVFSCGLLWCSCATAVRHRRWLAPGCSRYG